MAKEGHKKVFYDEEVVKKLDTITDICTRGQFIITVTKASLV